MQRTATCACGQLAVSCATEPLRVAVCHCLACKQQTGSSHNAAAFFPTSTITLAGESTAYAWPSEAGHTVTHHFCPICGSTVWWRSTSAEGLVAVGVGAFADDRFPAPVKEVWIEHRLHWIKVETMAASQG